MNLLTAVLTGEQSNVKRLIDDGKDVNVKDYYGQTPLSMAVKRGYKGIVEVLLAADNVDPDS